MRSPAALAGVSLSSQPNLSSVTSSSHPQNHCLPVFTYNIPPGNEELSSQSLKIRYNANVTASCHFQHPLPKAQAGVKGARVGERRERGREQSRHLCNSFNNMCKWARGLSVFIRPGEWSGAADTT